MEPFQVLVVISARGKDNESDTEAESGRLDTNTTQYLRVNTYSVKIVIVNTVELFFFLSGMYLCPS